MNELKQILELANYISGIAVAIIAGIGLRQLTIARQTARMNAKREAFRLAADQCMFYLQHVIPAQHAFSKVKETKKLAFFEKSKVEITGDSVSLTSTATPADLEALMDLEVAEASVTSQNLMEAFSLFFTSGVADETVGFSAVGHTFCSTVREYMPHLIIVGGGRTHYQNIFKLFFIWNNRIEGQRLAQERAKLEAKLGQVEVRSIQPIGME